MKDTTAAKWEKRRTIGRSRFLRNYALGFGFGFAVLLSLIEWSSQGFVDYRWVVIRLLFFTTIGFMTGAFLWDSREKRYSEFKEKN